MSRYTSADQNANDADRIYEMGRDAYRKGMSESDNPYHHGTTKASLWQTGFAKEWRIAQAQGGS